MRYSANHTCKLCGKSWKYKSDYIPSETVDWWYHILFLSHMLKEHRKDYGFKRTIRAIWFIFVRFLYCIMWFVLTLIKIIFYPFYWLLERFY